VIKTTGCCLFRLILLGIMIGIIVGIAMYVAPAIKHDIGKAAEQRHENGVKRP
jgi:formate/nitrite transporter FocA (FNT family)